MPKADSKITVPTYRGYIGTSKDALLIIQLAISGQLPIVSRRPKEKDRSTLAKSGNIYVFIEESSSIRRWTDGINWSPSRILGRFLIYRKLSKNGSSIRMNQMPVTAYEMAGGDKVLKMAKYKSHSLPQPVIDEEFEDGLVKKSISITIKENHEKKTIHLVSYYLCNDVIRGILKSPTSDLNIYQTEISFNLMNALRQSTLGQASFTRRKSDSDSASGLGFVELDGFDDSTIRGFNEKVNGKSNGEKIPPTFNTSLFPSERLAPSSSSSSSSIPTTTMAPSTSMISLGSIPTSLGPVPVPVPGSLLGASEHFPRAHYHQLPDLHAVRVSQKLPYTSEVPYSNTGRYYPVFSHSAPAIGNSNAFTHSVSSTALAPATHYPKSNSITTLPSQLLDSGSSQHHNSFSSSLNSLNSFTGLSNSYTYAHQNNAYSITPNKDKLNNTNSTNNNSNHTVNNNNNNKHNNNHNNNNHNNYSPINYRDHLHHGASSNTLQPHLPPLTTYSQTSLPPLNYTVRQESQFPLPYHKQIQSDATPSSELGLPKSY